MIVRHPMSNVSKARSNDSSYDDDQTDDSEDHNHNDANADNSVFFLAEAFLKKFPLMALARTSESCCSWP